MATRGAAVILLCKRPLFFLAMFGLCLFSGVQISVGGEKTLSPPLAVPFAIGTAGSQLSFPLEITKAQTYSITLEYLYSKGKHDSVWKLVGGSTQERNGKWAELGAPLSLRVRVTQDGATSTPVKFDKEVVAPRLSSWGEGVLDAKITDLQLAPGHYIITAENLINAPDLQTIKARLCVVKAYLGK